MQESTNEGSGRAMPGRWVGGLVGLVACVATVVAASVFATAIDGEVSAGNYGFLVYLMVGGLPIAFLGGRALLPAARSGGWPTALGVGFIFGLIAPPLGAIEVVLVGLLPFTSSTTGFNDNVTGFLVLLPIAIVYSYVAAIITIPAGLLWGLMARAIPDHLLEVMDLRR